MTFRRLKTGLLISITALSGGLASTHLGIASASGSTNGSIYFVQLDMMNLATSGTQAVKENGDAASVAAGLAKNTGTFAISPDGKKIAYMEQPLRSPTRSLIIANPDGSDPITLASGLSRSSLQFSADGTKIYFANDKILYQLDTSTANQSLSGNEVMTLTGQYGITYFDISSTGKIAYILYGACTANDNTQRPNVAFGVMVRDLNGSGSGTLVPGSCDAPSMATNPNVTNLDAQRVVWSPDGSKLYIALVNVTPGLRSNLVIDEFTTSGPTSNTPFYSEPGTQKNIYGLAMSPDGKRIAFYLVDLDSNNSATPNGIYVLDLTSKTSTRVKSVTKDASQIIWGTVLSTASATPADDSTTTTATPTTAPNTTAAPTTTAPADVFANAVPGVTKTDTKVYIKAPAKVAADSAIDVLTPAQNNVMDVQTKTPAVCLPNDDELVFIDEGRCIAEVVNTKTRKVLRTLRTTVVEDEVSELKVGNEIVTLAPIYFDVMSSTLDTKAMGRVKSLKARVSAAGSVLLVGHSGTLNGNSSENIAISRARAESTLRALRSVGAKGPFAVNGVGALDPARTGKTEADQAKNRRVVIVLIP